MTESVQPAAAWPAIPGPVDRESFFDAQRRHRRAVWRLQAAIVLVVALVSLPFSLLIGPFLWAGVILVADLINLVTPTYDPATLLGGVARAIDRVVEDPATSWTSLVAPVGLLIAPGMVVHVLAWLAMRRIVFRSGAAAILAAVGAREPDPADAEERQLVNVVHEMAIAAGLPAPRVAVFESDVVNAAAVGSSTDDAVVVVARRLLDDYDRSQTQGVIAHCVASIGNGDLRISMAIISLLMTSRMVAMGFGAATSRDRRRTARRVMFSALRPHEATGHEADLVRAVLTEELADDDTGGGLMAAPFALMAVSLSMLESTIGMLLIGPVLGRLWRTRRYLADADAVQLTRYPDGLGQGLARIAAEGGVVPGAAYDAHLFVVGPEIEEERRQAQLDELRAASAGMTWRERIAAGKQVQELMATPTDPTDHSLAATFVTSFQPPLHKRLERLQRMGSRTAPRARYRPESGPLGRTMAMIGWVIFGPLFLAIGVLALAAIAAATLVAGVIGMLVGMLVLTLVLFAHQWLRGG